MEKLNKQLAIKQCKVLTKLKGACGGTDCRNCPGYFIYNNNISCRNNGWSYDSKKLNNRIEDQILNSATKWLLKYDKPLTNIYSEDENE